MPAKSPTTPNLFHLFEFSEVLYTCELPGQPTTLQLYYNDGGEEGDQVGVYIYRIYLQYMHYIKLLNDGCFTNSIAQQLNYFCFL